MLAEVSFEERDGIPIARVTGEIDLSNASDLARSLEKATQQLATGLVLDFTSTHYLDSAGVHFVFGVGRQLRDRGQRLVLVVPPGSPVEAVLRVVGIESLAAVAPTVDGALAPLRDVAANAPK
jgi:anti-anti-sigma factor